ncbi:19396_t:CDS:2, partial [Racocetra persica]
VFTLVNQARLSSIYKKLQTNNTLQKWHYDSIKSIKDSIAYCKKNHNKCDKYNQKLVDRNDPKSKIKGAVLEKVDPENPENKNLLAICRCSYEDLNDLANCICDESRVKKGYLFLLLFPNAYKRKSANGRFWQDFNSLYEEVLTNEFKDQIKYLEFLNLLDPKDYNVQIKGHENENFCRVLL